MSGGAGARPAEARAVHALLERAVDQPAGLVVEGDAGIGKTTLSMEALDRAKTAGFRVLAARGAHAEVSLTFAILADLVAGVEPTVLAELPMIQQVALDRVLLHGGHGPATDERVAGAAFLSVMERLSARQPVFVCIDDLQWCDASSRAAVGYAMRRLKGRVGVLATVRTGDPDNLDGATWLQLPRPDALERIRINPMSLGGLQTMIASRLGLNMSRPAMVRIHQVSGGNPLYGLELARTHTDQTLVAETALPGTLAALVQTRINGLDSATRDVLLVASCVPNPTVAMVAQTLDLSPTEVIDVLGDAEDHGIVTIEGLRIVFTHPILAWAVYRCAGGTQRRTVHRRLADVVDSIELSARHLALGTSHTDAHTLEALDAAAAMARSRGAYAEAAELLDLAIGLGGDVPERRIRSADFHFRTGDVEVARTALTRLTEAMPGGALRAMALAQLAGIATVSSSFGDAADLLDRAVGEAESLIMMSAPLQIGRSWVMINLGRFTEAVRSADAAIAEAEEVAKPNVLSQALGLRELARFASGEGWNEDNYRRALELEDPESNTPVAVRASAHYGMILASAGHLDDVHADMVVLRERCLERGAESDVLVVELNSFVIEIMQGRMDLALATAESTMERARQLGGDNAMYMGATVRAWVCAYLGRIEEARRDLAVAFDAAGRCGAGVLAPRPSVVLGFTELSVGNYQEAVAALLPLWKTQLHAPLNTEVTFAWWMPDAVEALTALGRLDEAEPMISALESNGSRLDRPWMLAVGARARSTWLAASGDVAGAEQMAEQALGHHERLAMPFETARTLLLRGQLERRLRRRSATDSLRAAMAAFESIGTPLWADRARAELAKIGARPSRDGALSSAEQRVAELVASGMTNRDVAATLFISTKTVEATLSRIYRKLGVRGRAELGRHMGLVDGRGEPD